MHDTLLEAIQEAEENKLKFRPNVTWFVVKHGNHFFVVMKTYFDNHPDVIPIYDTENKMIKKGKTT